MAGDDPQWFRDMLERNEYKRADNISLTHDITEFKDHIFFTEDIYFGQSGFVNITSSTKSFENKRFGFAAGEPV